MSDPPARFAESRGRRVGRVTMGVLYLTTGALHFLLVRLYMTVMPPYLPWHRALVLISGVAEIAGGVGVLGPDLRVRRIAAWGLVALLVAVMPANVYMGTAADRFAAAPVWMLWARLPLQLPLIYWAWVYTREPRG